jgi:beta-glucosidase
VAHPEAVPAGSRPIGAAAASRRRGAIGFAAAATLALGLIDGAGLPARAAEPPATAHPQRWPSSASPAALTDPRTETFVDGLLRAMTLEEKVGQVIQADITTIRPEDLRDYPLGAVLAGGDSGPGGNERASPGEWLALARRFHATAIEQRPGRTPIPLLLGIDAVHGHSNVVGATIFPHNVGLGAARDPDLVQRVAAATAEEVAVTGFDWTFAPSVAVAQDVRWGRAYESYAEDPALVAAYAGPMVQGLQGVLAAGRPLASGRIVACAKHFLADGGTAQGRDQGDAAIGEDELIRVHAAGYLRAIPAGVLTVMASYSSWQGVKHHANRTLLTDVLKGRLGFAGFVVGDWNGHAQVKGCSKESCPQAFNAGIDMLMAPDGWRGLYQNTLAQARSGAIPASRLDDAVRRILRVKVKAGLFEPRHPLEGRLDRLGARPHRALAREAVRKSLVLLKNEGGILPLRASARVLVAGAGANDIGRQSGGWTITWQGTGNTNADFPNGQSIHDGIRDALAAGGGTAELLPDGAFRTRPDAAVVVLGEGPYAEGRGDVRTLEHQPGDKRDLALLRRLKAQGIPVVAVLLSGRPLWVDAELDAADAFVAAWLPGSEGGGVADVLIRRPDGSVHHDFTGKLAFAWPRAPVPQAPSEPGRDPLFAYGYGLRY